VDLEIPGPSVGSDIWPVELPDFKASTEVRSVALDSKLDVGTEDITDEHLYDSTDDSAPSSCIVLPMELDRNDS